MAIEVEISRRRFTVEEYHRMAEAGIFHPDERVELIEGEIVEMSPIGPPHASIVARMTAVLVSRLAGRAILWSQSSLLLRAQASYFQPDLILLRPRDDYYRSANPEPRDVLLVIEVMDSSVDRDRRVKLPLYARARVAEVWLVDVSTDTVEICRDPVGRRYRSARVAARGDQIAPLVFPDMTLAVTDLVG
jgi:Uma2 family endonuclease